MASDNLVTLSKQDQVAVVTLANPATRNALSRELLQALKDKFVAIEADDEVSAVLLTGKDNIFCAGMDINWLHKEDSMGMIKANIFIQDVFYCIENFRKPIVAALNGAALGAGLMLAMISDYRVALRGITVGMPEMKVGMPVFLAGAKIMQKYLTISQIKEILFWGELLNGEQAAAWGLVNQCVDSEEELMALSMKKARQLTATSPIGLQILKRCVNASYEMSQQAILTSELDTLGYFWQSEDCKEGLNSFLQKRKPVFTGK